MDYEKLIERLRTDSLYADKASLEIMDLCMEAATAIETLRDENEQLRAELAQAHESLDFARTKDAEIIRLGADLARVTAERDAAVDELHGKCSVCSHYTPYHNDGPCASCKFEVACFVPEKATDKWEWRGIKED